MTTSPARSSSPASGDLIGHRANDLDEVAERRRRVDPGLRLAAVLRDGQPRGGEVGAADVSERAEQERAMEEVLGEHLLDVARVAQVDDLDRRRCA